MPKIFRLYDGCVCALYGLGDGLRAEIVTPALVCHSVVVSSEVDAALREVMQFVDSLPASEKAGVSTRKKI